MEISNAISKGQEGTFGLECKKKFITFLEAQKTIEKFKFADEVWVNLFTVLSEIVVDIKDLTIEIKDKRALKLRIFKLINKIVTHETSRLQNFEVGR